MTNISDPNESKLRVPGFGLPLTFQLPCEKRFTHGINEWCQIPAVTAREFTMTATMNTITDKAGWSGALLDNDQRAINAWKEEAFGQPLMSERAWDWCMAELRDKAVEFREKQFTRVLDTGSCVCKSDELVSKSICDDLQVGLQDIWSRAGQEHTIVDPYVHPLVYGKTHVLEHSSTDLNLEYTGQSTLSPQRLPFDTRPEKMEDLIEWRKEQRRKGEWYYSNWQEIMPDMYWWSAKYQCLPCDVHFADGKLKIVSYINNLHPEHHDVYQALEKVLTACVGMWNECLIRGREGWKLEDGRSRDFRSQRQRGRYPLRILTYGVEFNVTPDWFRPFFLSHKQDLQRYLECKDILREKASSCWFDETTQQARYFIESHYYLEGIPPVPELTEEHWRQAEKYLGRTLARDEDVESLLRTEARDRRTWTHPEPGAFSYDEWKGGSNVNKAIINPIVQTKHWELMDEICGRNPHLERYDKLCSGPTHDRYDVHLEEFDGLQIVFKIGEWLLGVQKWRLEGHLNEHIVGVAIYAYDVHNAECTITLSQETAMHASVYRHNGEFQSRCTTNEPPYSFQPLDDNFDALAEVFGFENGAIIEDGDAGEFTYNDEMPAQEIGTIHMREGRLITFPNVLEYKVETSLIDDKVEGHVRYVQLLLVDPNYTVCSTSNVPPQQVSWSSATKYLLSRGLPREVVDLILTYCQLGDEKDAQAQKEQMLLEESWLEVARHTEMHYFKFIAMREKVTAWMNPDPY